MVLKKEKGCNLFLTFDNTIYHRSRLWNKSSYINVTSHYFVINVPNWTDFLGVMDRKSFGLDYQVSACNTYHYKSRK